MSELQTEGAPADAAAPAVSEPRKIAVVGEMAFAGKAVVKALLEKGLAVRALCPDSATELAVRGMADTATAARLEIHAGGLDSAVHVQKALEGVHGAVFVSPISLAGRIYRAKEHLEDVKRFAQAAEKGALRKLVYHSSTSAHPESRAQCLSDAAMAEGIIKESRCEDFVIRTPPLMGRNDGLVQAAVEKARKAGFFTGVWGYGGTEMNPLHADDFARCIARVFTGEPRELQPNVYLATGPERTTPLELYDGAAQKLGRFGIKFHLPLFVLRIVSGAMGPQFTERVELLFELDDARRVQPARLDTEALLGRGAKLMTVRQTQDEILAGSGAA